MSAKINVGKILPAMVEFENLFGEVSIEQKSDQNTFPLRCNAIPKDFDAPPFSGPPGNTNN